VVTDSEKFDYTWLNTASYTDSLFRTATVYQWADGVDQKGKRKSVKAKPDKVDFDFNLVWRAGDLHLKFTMITSGVVRRGKGSQVIAGTWDSVKEVTFPFSGLQAGGEIFEFTGRGFKGKYLSVNFQWLLGTMVFDKGSLPGHGTLAGDTMKYNQPRLPMPNLHNVGEDLQVKGVYPITVGAPFGAHSVILSKYSDVFKSLAKDNRGTLLFHTDSMRCLDSTLRKPILQQLKSLPPDKANNALFAEVLVLKLNIFASREGQFSPGFDTLIYDYSYIEPGHPLNGLSVSQICQGADQILSCTTSPSGLLPSDYYTVIHRINSAFASDSVDTLSWSGGKVKMKGVRSLKDVPFLRAVPGSIHPVNLPFQQRIDEPVVFALNQNYPNPFNPVTTIQFVLPQQANVTLKIYNMLGQEVRTLIDNQLVDDGEQEIDFDAGNLASGVYFYRITAEGISDPDNGIVGMRYVSVKKMLLIK
jgi:hypothetical protein